MKTKHNPTNENFGTLGETEVHFTFALNEQVNVQVDWTYSGGKPTWEELELEARNRLENAGLDRNLPEVEE